MKSCSVSWGWLVISIIYFNLLFSKSNSCTSSSSSILLGSAISCFESFLTLLNYVLSYIFSIKSFYGGNCDASATFSVKTSS